MYVRTRLFSGLLTRAQQVTQQCPYEPVVMENEDEHPLYKMSAAGVSSAGLGWAGGVRGLVGLSGRGAFRCTSPYSHSSPPRAPRPRPIELDGIRIPGAWIQRGSASVEHV